MTPSQLLHRIGRAVRGIARYSPTPRTALVLAIVAPVWALSSGTAGQVIATAIVALTALSVLVDAVRIPGSSYIELQRIFPPTIGVGDAKEARYEIRSTWPAALRASLTQQLPASISETEGPPDVMPLTDQSALVIVTAIMGKVRGSFPLGPVALTITGPWGLAKRSILYKPTDSISVAPSIIGAGRYRLLAAQHRLRTAGQRVIRRRGGGTSFANLRDYVAGDDPRHIDWKATARRHRLISREFTVEQGQTVMIAMDCGRMMTQLAGDRPRFEYALASALTLADIALSTGDRVGLIAFDSTVRSYIAPTRAPGTIGAIRDALTSVTASMTEPDYAAAFRTLTERNRRRSLIVLFTDVIDVRSSRAVIALSARSSERHLPLVVALRNEQLVAAAIPSPGATDEQTYESAAAEELLTAREEAIQIMRQTGVAVIDTAPAAMTAALINRYLEIKDRSAL
ncbi:MAG: DUF58 domain-containing protein [Gemmatimonadaceae bacterium]